jgi:hypothetical protein
MKNKFFVFFICCCCLLTVPVVLSVPAGALDSGTASITGNVILVCYHITVTGIDTSHATVSWKTNGNANSTVEYGTTTHYGSLSADGVMLKDHTISLSGLSPGTVYHYRVISGDLFSNRAVSADLTFITTALPAPTTAPTTAPTLPPTPAPYYGRGGGGGGRSNTYTGPGTLQQSGLPELPQQPDLPQQPGLPGQPASQNVQSSQIYPIGFPGLIYNADGQGTLIIGISAARDAVAAVTIYSDRVEVYQHHSPGVLLTFWGNNFKTGNGNITGIAPRAEFVIDPLNSTLALGNVSGSVHATLPALTGWATIDLTIPGDLSADTLNQFQDILSSNGLQLDTVAYTLNVQKVNLTTGPANVTFTIPASWVDGHGGKDAVRITRISEESGKQELIDTVYEGVDADGNMIFRGDSPNGTSLFGLVTAEAPAATQQAHSNVSMFVRLIDILMNNPVVFIGVIALVVAITYFVWWKREFFQD